MGRRLSPWEREQRDRERKARAAARRAETAARRAKEKKARDKIKAQEKAQKIAKTEKEIQVNRSRVALYDSYLLHLEKLHTKYDLNKFESGYKYRLRKRTYKPGTWTPDLDPRPKDLPDRIKKTPLVPKGTVVDLFICLFI